MDSQFSQPHTTITTPKLSVMDAFVELLWERPVLVITLWLSLFTVLFVCSWFLGIVPPLETDEGEDAELITEVTAAAIVEDTPVRIVIDAIGVDTKINNSDENIRIFPKPGKDIIYIDYLNYFNEMYVDIYDLIGHKLTSQIVINHEINTKGLSLGIYTIVARNNEFTKAIKWIKF